MIGDREYTVKMVNVIYAGEMKALLEGSSPVDWNAIEAKVKPYGAAGREILLRARTVHYFNAKEWSQYAVVAKAYLEEFGAHCRRMKEKCLAMRWVMRVAVGSQL